MSTYQPFKFKAFSIADDKCAMKIGTDGVLLGAWVQGFSSQIEVLDIGSGSGLISLMLAQRFTQARIYGVEIEEAAYNQSVDNARKSPWNNRLHFVHARAQDYALTVDHKFDIIVSNPPFFAVNQQLEDPMRALARQHNILDINSLYALASNLLEVSGHLYFIYPFEALNQVIIEATKYNLYIDKVVQVFSKPSKKPKRILVQVVKQPVMTTYSNLFLRVDDHNYSPQFITLTQDFYLHF